MTRLSDVTCSRDVDHIEIHLDQLRFRLVEVDQIEYGFVALFNASQSDMNSVPNTERSSPDFEYVFPALITARTGVRVDDPPSVCLTRPVALAIDVSTGGTLRLSSLVPPQEPL